MTETTYPKITSVAGLDELPAESVVLDINGGARSFSSKVPYQRYQNGDWYTHGAQRQGCSSTEVWDLAGSLVLLYRGDKPVLAGMTQIKIVHEMARYHRWEYEPLSGQAARPFALFRGSGTTVEVRHSKTTGRLTRAKLRWANGDELEVTSSVEYQVLHWLADDFEFRTERTP